MKIKKFSDVEKLPTKSKVILILLLLTIFLSLFYLWSIKQEYIVYPSGCKEVYNKGKLISDECPLIDKVSRDEWYIQTNGAEWINESKNN